MKNTFHPHRLAEFGVGLLFGIGLILAGMTDPSKVLGFWTWRACGTPRWPS